MSALSTTEFTNSIDSELPACIERIGDSPFAVVTLPLLPDARLAPGMLVQIDAATTNLALSPLSTSGVATVVYPNNLTDRQREMRVQAGNPNPEAFRTPRVLVHDASGMLIAELGVAA